MKDFMPKNHNQALANRHGRPYSNHHGIFAVGAIAVAVGSSLFMPSANAAPKKPKSPKVKKTTTSKQSKTKKPPSSLPAKAISPQISTPSPAVTEFGGIQAPTLNEYKAWSKDWLLLVNGRCDNDSNDSKKHIQAGQSFSAWPMASLDPKYDESTIPHKNFVRFVQDSTGELTVTKKLDRTEAGEIFFDKAGYVEAAAVKLTVYEFDLNRNVDDVNFPSDAVANGGKEIANIRLVSQWSPNTCLPKQSNDPDDFSPQIGVVLNGGKNVNPYYGLSVNDTKLKLATHINNRTSPY
jgi:hypothetical protein